MAGRFSRSWQLMKASAAVLRSDKSLLTFPLASGICCLLVAASFLIPIAMAFAAADGSGEAHARCPPAATWRCSCSTWCSTS